MRYLLMLVGVFMLCATAHAASQTAQSNQSGSSEQTNPSHNQSQPGPIPPSQSGPDGTRGVLLVAFGTSHPSALGAYAALDADFRAAYPNGPVVWAYTSSIIRKKLAKQGMALFSVSEALDAMAAKGVKELVVQSLHVAAGEEFSELERTVGAWLHRNPDCFTSVRLGRPLFESRQDRDEVITAVLEAFPAERASSEAILFMGHGQAHGRAELVLDAVGFGFAERDPLVRLATVEGSSELDSILEDLDAAGVRRVWLQPLMIVAGDHANNDLVGSEPDSWASRVTAAGMTWKGNLRGLGDIAGVRAVFVRHATEAADDLAAGRHAQ